MPTITRSHPLLPEGEYCGQARRVTQEWSKPKPRADGTKPEPVMIFRIPLHTPGGASITAILRVMPTTAWTWEQACKSGEMIPQGDSFSITPDDFENRIFYFGIIHSEYLGQARAEVRFHAKSHALQINPALADVSFPNEAPKPIYLRAVEPNPTPSAPPAQTTAPITPPPPPHPPAPSVNEAKAAPVDDRMGGISEAEFKEALEYAKKLQREKQNPPNAAAA
jgi:hypothetical protein